MNSNQAANKLVRELSTRRHKKIKRLRSKIVAGTYRVNSCELARALVMAR